MKDISAFILSSSSRLRADNGFMDELSKLYESGAFNPDMFLMNAMYMEGMSRGIVRAINGEAIEINGKVFMRSDIYGTAALLELKDNLNPIIKAKLTEIRISLLSSCEKERFIPLINGIEDQLSGASEERFEDFVAGFMKIMNGLTSDFDRETKGSIDRYIDHFFGGGQRGALPKEFTMLFMVYIVMTVIKLFEIKQKISQKLMLMLREV